MTPDSSRGDLLSLRQAATTGWEIQVEDLDLDAAEQLALTFSQVVAQALLQAALTRHAGRASYPGARTPCAQCGGPARFVGYRTRWLRTLCGDQQVTRADDHDPEGPKANSRGTRRRG